MAGLEEYCGQDTMGMVDLLRVMGGLIGTAVVAAAVPPR
jgi:hypothetical protein